MTDVISKVLIMLLLCPSSFAPRRFGILWLVGFPLASALAYPLSALEIVSPGIDFDRYLHRY